MSYGRWANLAGRLRRRVTRRGATEQAGAVAAPTVLDFFLAVPGFAYVQYNTYYGSNGGGEPAPASRQV